LGREFAADAGKLSSNAGPIAEFAGGCRASERAAGAA